MQRFISVHDYGSPVMVSQVDMSPAVTVALETLSAIAGISMPDAVIVSELLTPNS